MKLKAKYHPIVKELAEMIQKNKWEGIFEKAIKKANKKNVPVIDQVKTLENYLDWLNDWLYWVPIEDQSGQNIDNHLCAFYFIADQEPLLSLQNKIAPAEKTLPLTPFSAWMVRYADALGVFLDSAESLTEASEKSFYETPAYNMDEYLRPRGGWKSFNQVFARNFKPGFRPVAAISDPTVIISPADSTFVGQWEIRKDAQITAKGMNWKISELLDDSPYQDQFVNGIFMHAYLSPTDYHRLHTPVPGKVLEARVIQGQVYQEVEAKPINDQSEEHHLHTKRVYDAPDNTGYQFAQARGLIVIDSPIGLVAVLPIGMSQVSSVVITAEVGITLRKGEEISYFQFGGSDVILIFQASSNVSITAQPEVHYKMGTRIAQAFPVL